MAKLVVLTEGLAGRAYELKAEKSSIGRLEDNAFPIPNPSVSGYHCEAILRGEEVVIKDLNSTNGTFINNSQITGESVLKPGQLLRLGQVELKLESADKARKPEQSKTGSQQGVKFNELEGGSKTVSFDKTTAFSKKSDKGIKVFIGALIVIGLIIVCIIVYSIIQSNQLTSTP